MQQLTKTDYAIGALVGFFTGIAAIPTVYNIGVRDLFILLALPWVVAPLWAIGVWFGGFLGRRISFFTEFGKYVAVGFLSAAIDFGVLNVMSMVSGVTAGIVIGGVNIPGFILAVINAYLWNRLWVFSAKASGTGVMADFPKFLAVTIAALFINSSIVAGITIYVPPQFGLETKQWLNAAKLVGNAVIIVWNFLGYKFVVFRAK